MQYLICIKDVNIIKNNDIFIRRLSVVKCYTYNELADNDRDWMNDCMTKGMLSSFYHNTKGKFVTSTSIDAITRKLGFTFRPYMFLINRDIEDHFKIIGQ